MAETLCGFPDRDDVLVTYVYDEMDTSARATFDAHLAICARCRKELNDLQGVREDLAQWSPPVLANGVVVNVNEPIGNAGVTRFQPAVRHSWWREIPAWAQVAAAMLFLGVAAGIANLDVRYDAQGLSVRTGWSKPLAGATNNSGQAAGAVQAPALAQTSPWRADLTALEQQLRTEMRAANGPAAVPVATDARSGLTDAEVMRRVRSLIEASEKRQQNELALRTVEMMNSVRAQRNADLMKIDAALGTIQDKTDSRLLKQNATLNYLVSSKQKQ
jgi:anti-sigma factor RsiW